MEDKGKIILTIFGIVAIVAVVGLIGIYNKPTYILISPSNLEEGKSFETKPSVIAGMAVSNIASKEACLRLKKIYEGYSWFDDWQWFKENCEAKYDLTEGPTHCETGFTDEYRCEDNYLQRKWQNSVCQISWGYMHYCEYGCSNGACNPKPAQCTENWLYDYKCHNNISQRLYQYADCETDYVDLYVCKKGCAQKTGKCIEDTKSCDQGLLDVYRCSGNYLQQAYQHINCLKTYDSIKFCNNGCSDNKCN